MDKPINERWLQFSYLNKNGNITKLPLKFPFHTDLEVDQEFTLNILGKDYEFQCVAVETKSNQGETVDKVFVIATNHS